MAKKGPKKKYSAGTKRHATQFPGVYQREAERVVGKPDVVFDISYKRDGRKVWEKVGWKSQGYSAELARQIRNERIIAMQHGEDLPKDKKKAPFFRDVAAKYLQWAATHKRRAGIEDQSRYDCHLKGRFADKRLDEITPFDLERMKADLAKAGLSAMSVVHCLALVRGMFNKAADWGLWQGVNPVRKVKKPVVRNARDRFLSFDEAETLLKALRWNHRYNKEIADPKLHDIALLSLHTGARAGEIFNLKGHDVDFQHGLIAFRDTKNNETRYSPMTAKVREMLQARRPGKPDAYIFTTARGMKIKEVSNAFEGVIERCGFNKGVKDARRRVVFHTLRHTFASWLAIQGTPLYTIAKLMGHKSISMSERYAHLSPDHKRDAVNGLEAALNGEGEAAKEKKNDAIPA